VKGSPFNIRDRQERKFGSREKKREKACFCFPPTRGEKGGIDEGKEGYYASSSPHRRRGKKGYKKNGLVVRRGGEKERESKLTLFSFRRGKKRGKAENPAPESGEEKDY